MRFRIVALMCFILATAVSFAAQTRTITNADLEKYRQARLTAEREYRENYVKLGMPSPEELERRREQSRIETEKLSEKLRGEQLQRERFELERQQLTPTYIPYPEPGFAARQYVPAFFGSYYYSSRPRTRINRHQQTGYFAGGQFWPTGNLTPSAPMFRQVRR